MPPAPFTLVEGETYRIVFDENEYESVCGNDNGALMIGHAILDDNGESTSGSFHIMYTPPELEDVDGSMIYIMILSTVDTHTLAIYKV